MRSLVINFTIRTEALWTGLRQWRPMVVMPLSPTASWWPRAQPPGEARIWTFQKGQRARLKTSMAGENRCGRYRSAKAVRCCCLARAC